MATYKYKFMLLNDDRASTSQSRGISLQFNGYVPFNGTIDTTTMPDIGSLVSDGSIVLMLKDLNYISDNSKNVRSADSRYEQYKSEPASHMFTKLSAVPSAEFATVDSDGDSRGSTTLDIPLYDSMFGDRLTGEARIDGIILYGQAYNVDFYNPTAQGQLESAVPLALVVFEDPQPTVDPSSDLKSMSNFRMALSFRILGESEGLVVEDTEEYRTWKQFAGCFHVVNNDMLTSGSFILRGRGVEPIADTDLYEKEMVYEDGKTVDFNSRVFFTSDIDGSNYDRNVDFGSPARLTVLNREKPVSADVKIPQTLIGKVSYSKDENDFVHGYWDGVSQSYYAVTAKKELQEEAVSGSVYDIDWISNQKPAISLFSVDNDYSFVNSAYGLESACFANGTNLFSEESQSCGDGLNIADKKVSTRGNAVVIGSVNVSAYCSNAANVEQNVYVENSKNLIIDNVQMPSESRVTAIATESSTVTNSNGVLALGTKYSTFKNSKDTIAIGGLALTDFSLGNTLIGTGEKNSLPANQITGYSVTDPSTTKLYYPSSCVIIGRNNSIDSKYEENYYSPSNVIEIGRDLQNDPRANSTSMQNVYYSTLILGQSNNLYYEEKKAKSVVIGGYRSTEWSIPSFKYNALEVSQNFPDGRLIENNGPSYHYNKESVASLTDVKGRKISYGSCAIELNMIHGTKGNENYKKENFDNLGRINLFKLYELLSHLEWIPDGNSDGGGYVRMLPNKPYDRKRGIWDAYGVNNDPNTGRKSTCLIDLVNDETCRNPYYPMK